METFTTDSSIKDLGYIKKIKVVNNNTDRITIAAEKLYKLSQAANRESAKEQGFYDGRFLPRTVESKKRIEYLRLRRDKNSLKNQ